MKEFSKKLIVSFVLTFGISCIFQALSPTHSVEATTSYSYYVKISSNLYSSTAKSKKILNTIPINMKLKTSSVKSSKMYKVSYLGKTGYVYASNLSTKKVSSVPFGKTVRVGNFTIKVNQPKNESGSSWMFEGNSKFISLYVTIKNYGNREWPGYFSELYVNDKYYDATDIQYYSTKYEELDTLVDLSKDKTMSGYVTFKVSPGKELELVYIDYASGATITFTGKN
ncbi:DUF4352 domain-containing protein [Peribacillus simplex]|uniref:DUF4352 domain-containing protein n=1 Tax=Peribacillus simplex TaxID=1478 RepID=UPI003D2B488D